MMKLQILKSRKGTRVVTATNLHQVLQLPTHHYNRDVKTWLSDIYAFKDAIRFPLELKDFSVRRLENSPRRDYYISVELAKMITLNSSSPVKAQYARQLAASDQDALAAKSLTVEQVQAILELTKVMGLTSCQKSVEQEHLTIYKNQAGYTAHWWQYRANLLGYSVEKLRSKMSEIGKNYRGKNYLQMLMQLDKYEIIRMAVIDLFIALGKSEAYAKNVGNLAKFFAQELNVQIWDDRNTSIPFAQPEMNRQLIQDVQELKKEGYLALWA